MKQIEITKLSQKAFIDKEIRLLTSIRHDNVVQYHGSLMTHSRVCLFLDFCENGSLVDCIDRTGDAFSEEEVAVILADTVTGLSYLHHHGVIHR